MSTSTAEPGGTSGTPENLPVYDGRERRQALIALGACAAVSLGTVLALQSSPSARVGSLGLGALPLLGLAGILAVGCWRRTVGPYRRFWGEWAIALAGMVICHLALAEPFGPIVLRTSVAGTLGLVTAVVGGHAVLQLLQARSGLHSRVIDTLDLVVILIVTCAMGGLALGWIAPFNFDREHHLMAALVVFVLPSIALVACALLRSFPPHQRQAELALVGFAVLVITRIWLIQVELLLDVRTPRTLEGILQVAAFGLAAIHPLLAHRAMPPIHADTGERIDERVTFAPVVVLLLVAAMSVEAWVVHTKVSWAGPAAVAVVGTVVVLTVVRSLVASSEERRHIASISDLAAKRRQLVELLVASSTTERNLMAELLYAQAIESLTVVGTVRQASHGHGGPTAEAMDLVLADVQAQLLSRAEQLRRLQVARGRSDSSPNLLAASLRAWAETLPASGGAPLHLEVRVEGSRRLPWPTQAALDHLARALALEARDRGATVVTVVLDASASDPRLTLSDDAQQAPSEHHRSDLEVAAAALGVEVTFEQSGTHTRATLIAVDGREPMAEPTDRAASSAAGARAAPSRGSARGRERHPQHEVAGLHLVGRDDRTEAIAPKPRPGTA